MMHFWAMHRLEWRALIKHQLSIAIWPHAEAKLWPFKFQGPFARKTETPSEVCVFCTQSQLRSSESCRNGDQQNIRRAKRTRWRPTPTCLTRESRGPSASWRPRKSRRRLGRARHPRPRRSTGKRRNWSWWRAVQGRMSTDPSSLLEGI